MAFKLNDVARVAMAVGRQNIPRLVILHFRIDDLGGTTTDEEVVDGIANILENQFASSWDVANSVNVEITCVGFRNVSEPEDPRYDRTLSIFGTQPGDTLPMKENVLMAGQSSRRGTKNQTRNRWPAPPEALVRSGRVDDTLEAAWTLHGDFYENNQTATNGLVIRSTTWQQTAPFDVPRYSDIIQMEPQIIVAGLITGTPKPCAV